MNNKSLYVLILIGALSCLQRSYAQLAVAKERIHNDKIGVSFHHNTGALEAIDLTKDRLPLLRSSDENNTSPWKIDIDHSGETIVLDIHDAASFSSDRKNNRLELTWKDFPGIARAMTVVATVELLPDSAMSAWRIRVDGIDNLLLQKVTFPIIAGLQQQEAEHLAVPDWMGALLKSPRNFLTAGSSGFSWEYPGHMSMQMMTVYGEGGQGTYFASDDSLAYSKTFRIFRDTANLLAYAIDHYPAYDETTQSFEPPYAVMLGGFKGDWLTAAQMYKGWAVEQSWSKNSRLYTKQTPEWVNKTSFWVWNRGRSSNVLSPAVELNKRLGGGVNVLWHWWHKGSYDDTFPEYFPPRDGDEVFKAAVDEAKEAGVNAIVYMNALKWGPSTPSWETENVEPHTVKNIDGSMKSQVYNIFTKKALTYMCESTDFWKHKYASLVDSAINEYRLSGIYMDQTCLNSRCYDPSHGHAVGGGNYWMEHHADKNRLLRQTMPSGRQKALAAEGVGENWLPYNDMFLALQVSRERYAGVSQWRTIPLFQSVYHEYGITFGNYSSLLTPPYDEMWPKESEPEDAETPLNPEFNKQFLMEQARSFAWGMQPMIANYQPSLNEIRSKETEYLQRLAVVRQSGLPYFLYGSFLRAPDITARQEKVVVSKLSIYAGRNEQVTRFEDTYPTLYTSAWESPDQTVAVAVASIDEESYPIKFEIDAKDYGLKEKGAIYLNNDEGKKKIGTYTKGKIQVDFTLPPLGIAYVEFI